MGEVVVLGKVGGPVELKVVLDVEDTVLIEPMPEPEPEPEPDP